MNERASEIGKKQVEFHNRRRGRCGSCGGVLVTRVARSGEHAARPAPGRARSTLRTRISPFISPRDASCPMITVIIIARLDRVVIELRLFIHSRRFIHALFPRSQVRQLRRRHLA